MLLFPNVFSLYLLWEISVRYYCAKIYHNLFCFDLSWLHKIKSLPISKNKLLTRMNKHFNKKHLGFRMYTIHTIHYFRDEFKNWTWPNSSNLHWGHFCYWAMCMTHHLIFLSQGWHAFHSWHFTPLSLKK